MKDKFYVPFQIAEMLKEKGYPQDFAHNDALYALPNGEFYWALDVDIARRRSEGEPILAPTYPDVLDWFEEKGIMIGTDYYFETERWRVEINSRFDYHCAGNFYHRDDALNEAIIYALKTI